MREMPAFTRNLLLDVGLDFVASAPISALFTYLALGTGTKPTKRDSGEITVSRAGTVVTASSGYFEEADVGRLVKLDSGPEFYVAAFTSATIVTAATAGDDAPSQAMVWYVNETGHEAEFLRFAKYSNAAGDCGSTWSAGAWTHKRTFLSDPFAVGKLVKEVSWTYAEGANLYGRALVPGGGDYVSPGQQYNVVVEHVSSWGPAAAQVQPDIGNNGFSTAGQFALEYVPECPVSSNGGYDPDWSYMGDLQCFACGGGKLELRIGTSDAALTPLAGGGSVVTLGSLADVGGVKLGQQAYVAGSRVNSWRGTLAVGQANSAAIRSITLGCPGTGFRIGRVLLDAPQTKDSLHTLTVGFKVGWDRVLVN